jgi:hypothetical protein
MVLNIMTLKNNSKQKYNTQSDFQPNIIQQNGAKGGQLIIHNALFF